MDIGEIVNLIGNSGFPIVLCVYVIWLKQKDLERHEAQIEKMRESHDAREAEFSAVMQQTATAITELSTLMKNGGVVCQGSR